MSCGDNPAANLAKATERIDAAAKKGAQDRLSPGVVSLALLLPERGSAEFQTGRIDSRAEHRSARRARAQARDRHRRLAFRTALGGHLPQHRGGDRRRRIDGGKVSQDAYSGRSALLREVLFHPGRSRVSEFSNALTRKSARWSAGINGFPKARGSRRCRARRFFFIRRRSAGFPTSRARWRKISAMPGS